MARDTKVIGEAISRIDGLLKVTGAANYGMDWPIKNVAYAFIVKSTIAAGTITDIDTAAAEKSPGVIAVITHKNAAKLTPYDPMRGVGILQDNKINFYGQNVGIVVAETFEQARSAARAVNVTYQTAEAKVDFDKCVAAAVKPANKNDALRGDFESAFNSAERKIDVTYSTPVEHHHPMEPHSAIAMWEGDNLTLYSATQGVGSVQNGAARAFGIKADQVHVVSPHVGGGFGSKGGPWTNVVLAALASKMVNRPVKLALTRQNMFNSTGLRQANQQRLRVASAADGKLVALGHDTTQFTTTTNEFSESCGLLAGMMYDVPNSRIGYKAAPMNVIAPTFQRAPGESTGSFALESAIDEMAYALKMDPVEFRIKNEPAKDPSNGRPWSSRATVECLKRGAEMIGWKNRKQEPRQNRNGEYLVGYGVAIGSYPSRQSPTSTMLKLSRKGDDVTASVELAASDIGTGTHTIIAQTAAETLGLPMSKVAVKIGDSTLPPAAGSVGSIGAASFCNSVADACNQAKTELQAKTDRKWIAAPTVAQLMDAAALNDYQTRVDARAPASAAQYSSHAFNANFSEVWVNELTGVVRVQRHVSVTGAGRVMNPKTARSQIIGGCVWGIGMALTEESVMDVRWGNFITRTFADYHIPVNLDVGSIEVAFIPEEDKFVNKLGIKGIGEVGIVGVAGAIANAVFNATGKRVRDLPITPDKLI